MLALGKLLQDLVTGSIDKALGLVTDVVSAGSTLITSLVDAAKAFIGG